MSSEDAITNGVSSQIEASHLRWNQVETIPELVVNTVFEMRLANLVNLLHKISHILELHHIPYELIGGLALTVYVDEVDPQATPLTRDVDLMIHRCDLERTKVAAAQEGFRFRHVAGIDMLIYGSTESARNAVHLVFSGEKITASQSLPNPSIRPTQRTVDGGLVEVIPLEDLIRMKLSSYRLKDQLHVQIMDAAGLIAPQVERALPPELRDRLEHIRTLR